MYMFLATCKTRNVFVIFSLVKEKLGCGFLASSLFVWSHNYFVYISILVSYRFHPFGIRFFLALIIDVRKSRSDLAMIRKSGKHSQISKYFRVPYIKTGECEG